MISKRLVNNSWEMLKDSSGKNTREDVQAQEKSKDCFVLNYEYV